MNNRVTSEEVANQFAKAIQLLLEWYRQERLSPTQARESKAGVADNERQGYQTSPELGSLPHAITSASKMAKDQTG